MKLAILAVLTIVPFVQAGEPDLPPQEEKPVRVPAAPLTPAEEAKREALTRFGLGFFRTRDDRLVDAMKQFQAAVQNDPKAVAPLRELVKVYAELGRDAAAIRTAREVLSRDPGDAEIAQQLGRLLLDGKKYAEASKVLLQALNSPRANTDPTARLVLLRELAGAAEKAGDFPAREKAAREQLTVLNANKAELLKLELYTPEQFQRQRARAYEDLGRALVGLKKFDSASASFEAARDLYTDPKGANDLAGRERLHWNLCESLAAQGEVEKALKELERYLEQRPAAFAPYERWVQLMSELNRKPEIPGTLGRMAKLNPGNPAPAWLAAAATLENDPDAGDALFAKLLEKADKPEYFRVLAKAYESANLAKKFLDIADRLFLASRPKGHFDPKTSQDKPKDPDSVPEPKAADVQRARFFNEAGLTCKGFTKPLIRQLETDARESKARYPDTYELVMTLSAREGQLAAFTPALRAGINETTLPHTRWLMVLCLSYLRNWTDLAHTAEAISLAEKGSYYPSIAVQAAIAYAELGQEKKAIEVVEKLPGRVYIRKQKARIYNILGKHKEALLELEEILKLDKPKGDDLHDVLRSKAATLYLLKESAKAESIHLEMLDNNPDDQAVINDYVYNLAEQGRKLDEAEAMIRRAIELDRDAKLKIGDPDVASGNYFDTLGWVLFKRGKFAEARKVLEDASKYVELTENPVVWDHLGDTYLRLDEKKLAAAAYQKAIKLYSGSHEGRQNGRLDDAARKLKLVQ